MPQPLNLAFITSTLCVRSSLRIQFSSHLVFCYYSCRMPTVTTRKKAKKKNRFMNVINLLTPIRILKQARQLYMKGVEDCAGGLGYGGVGSYPAVPSSRVSKRFSVNASKASDDDEDEQQKELLRIVSNRTVEKKMRVDIQGRRQPVMAYNGMKRSYGVGLGKIGRIDEDKPCCFEEDQIDMKTHLLLLYPTIRAYAINRHVMHYY